MVKFSLTNWKEKSFFSKASIRLRCTLLYLMLGVGIVISGWWLEILVEV